MRITAEPPLVNGLGDEGDDVAHIVVQDVRRIVRAGGFDVSVLEMAKAVIRRFDDGDGLVVGHIVLCMSNGWYLS
jgi:hypothetical protein